MKLHLKIAICLLMACNSVGAQSPTVETLTSGTKTSLRGLSVVNDNVIWVSGSRGTVGRSNNAGKNWNWFTVKGYEKTEFRDIEAFDANTAIIMGVGEPGLLLKTTDGGESWRVVYENNTKGMFLDAMDFVGEKYGMVIGDPINGSIFLAETLDGGDTWQPSPAAANLPRPDSGEAFFAASGTNIRVLDRDEAVFVTGGMRSRLFTRKPPVLLPMVQGKETTGANSVTVWNNRKMQGGQRLIVVGGDFNEPVSAVKNCYYSKDRGKTWKAPVTPPHGYRSCVEYISMQKAISCGLTGVDITYDGGRNWIWISKEGFHVCRKAKNGEAIFFAGNSGKIAKIVWE